MGGKISHGKTAIRFNLITALVEPESFKRRKFSLSDGDLAELSDSSGAIFSPRDLKVI